MTAPYAVRTYRYPSASARNHRHPRMAGPIDEVPSTQEVVGGVGSAVLVGVGVIALTYLLLLR